MRWTSRALGLCVVVGAGSVALADIDTTPHWDNATVLGPFGEGPPPYSPTPTYGQTFTPVGPETVLTSFTFWLKDVSDSGGGENDVVDFAAYVMEWDGSKAIGDVLHDSGLLSTVASPALQEFTIDVGTVPLTAGQQYVAFFSTLEHFDNAPGWAQIGMIPEVKGDVYTGGAFMFSNATSGFTALTSSAWNSAFSDRDLAFKTNLSSPVPLPGSALLGALGLAAVAWVRRRRTA